jgi:uncharacterized protein (TIGR02996 family)
LLLDQLAQIGDVRTAAPLRAAFSDFVGTYYNHHRQAKRIVGKLAMEPPASPVLPAADVERLAAIARSLDALEAASPERKLIAAIAAAGDDDAPRLVYADWLAERGHARGEAIVLGCKRSRSDAEEVRLVELLATPYLYGALADFGHDAPVRGLPTAAKLPWRVGTLTWRAVAGHPLVALVETIDVGDIQRQPDLADLVAFARAATGLETIKRVETELWDDARLPGFRRVKNQLRRL